MATQSTVAPTSAKTKRVRKDTRSPARKAAELELQNAKSDQEKTVARAKVKALRFTDIVVPRVKGVINGLRRVENMANRAAYSWTDEQAEKIITALEGAVAKVTSKLRGAKKEVDSFSL